MSGLMRWLFWLAAAVVGLQLFFLARIATMAAIDPQSTSFQRSEAWRLMNSPKGLKWRQQWVPYAQISEHLKRAVIAAEDGAFVNHDGVEWDAIEKAWQKNAQAEEQALKRARAGRVKVIGGSTITQQLAKNLLLSGERNLARKGQEFVLTMMLEGLLSKRRILEIYLNNVEWGEGVFGAEAAAQHYFRKPASRLTPYEAARLSVMLPRPKFFEKLPSSAYLASRSGTIMARMGDSVLP